MKISKFNSIVNYNLDPIRTQHDALISFSADKFRIKKRPTLEYGDRGVFSPSEFNLFEIGIIEDVESYVRQSFQKKTALMFKEGEDFAGKNKDTINYIKRRIKQIERVTGIPWRSLLRETGYYLISRSNFFWVIVRDENKSGGKVVNGVKPIAGFFPMAPETVEVKKDRDTGQVVKYKQTLYDGRTKEFDPQNVVHFSAYRKSGFTFGTPAIVSVKDDIRALRRIEENVELLIYQTLFPIFHYKVGTETKPAGTVQLPDGSVVDEVEHVRLAIANMPSEGGIVTPERHEVSYIGAEGKSLRANDYLQHFKRRVFSGLGTSAVDFGEGDTSNRATADSMSRTMVDSVKDYQDILAEQINHFIIIPLLIEANFRLDLFDDLNIVEFLFKEIDIETQLKKNVNAQLLYNGNIIDIHETRQVAGYEPLASDQEKDLFTRRVTQPEIKLKTKSQEQIMEMQIEAQKEISNQTAIANAHVKAGTTTTKTSKSPTGGTSKTVTKVGKGVSKQIKAMSAPSNQHGTKTGPQRSIQNSILYDSIAVNTWSELKNEVLAHINKSELDIAWINTIIGISLSNMRDKYNKVIEKELIKGFRDVKTLPLPNSLDQSKLYFVSKLSGYINNLTRTIQVKLHKEFNKIYNITPISKSELLVKIAEVFDKMEFRLSFFDTTEKDRANNLGRAYGLKQLGYITAGIKINGDCEHCMQQDTLVSLEHIVPEDLPPNHSNCSCKIEITDFTNKEERCILKVKRQLRAKNPSWGRQKVTSSAIAICRTTVKG